MDKDDLIQQYVNLYKILWNGNSGLSPGDLQRMSEKELTKEIKQMKVEIKNKNSYFPGFNHQ